MTAKTRHGESGYGIRRAGSFAGKTPSGGGGGSGHPVSRITRPGIAGFGVRRCGSFAGKTPSAGGGGGGAHPVTRITRPMVGGFGGRRCGSFAGKTPAGGGGGGGGAHPVSTITRNTGHGYGARRCGSFAGKTAGSGGGSSARPTLAAYTRLGLSGHGASLNASFARAGGIARPIADITAGGWLPSSGSDLWNMVNEVAVDETDYIYTTTAGDTCELTLSGVSDPGTSSGQVFSYQAWSPSGSAATFSLLQGATVIATWFHATLPTVPTIYQRALTAGECDAITDYGALVVRITS